MAIKNYTSGVDVYQSLGEIQGALAAHGARRVMVDYGEDRAPAGITFVLAQMAFIESGAVEIDEVFLPYLMGRGGQTLYQAYRCGGLLTEGKE